MLNLQENDLLCRVGAGTPMGDLMRQYWLPALLSTELPSPDCPPTRLRLLGENLVGFRTTSGSVGLIQSACPHRGASLFFGRNEEEGLRCVYHGWKFDVEGNCVDMPSEPAKSNFKSKVKATTYRCIERGGVIWAYMGKRETAPPLPEIEPNMLPDGEYAVQKAFRNCNWVQGLEGDIDTGHLAFLHLGAMKPENAAPKSFDFYTVNDRAPRYDVRETEFGTSYGTYRPAEEDTYYWRVAHFLFPCYTMIPTGVLGVQVLVRGWVPVDDEHMMFWSFAAPRTLSFGQGAGQGGAARAGRSVTENGGGRPVPAGASQRMEMLPDTSDWLGKFRLVQGSENDYLIDREEQRERSYTGISGIHQQDQAVTESMGQIYDRSHEHLGTSDAMVIRTRRRLINAARALRDSEVTPPGVDTPSVYEQRSGGVILPNGADWRKATQTLRTAFVEHTPEEVVAPAIGG